MENIVKVITSLSWWKTIKQCTIEFWEKTLLHGSRNIVETGRIAVEKSLWFVILITAFGFSLFFVAAIWLNFTANPAITTLDNQNYPIYNVPFPSVGLCNVNRISQAKVDYYAAKL